MTESISCLDGWFDRWFAAFAVEDPHGTWSSLNGSRIPYVRAVRRVAGVPVRVARAAANVHTPRYDALGGPVSPDQLRAMATDLDVDLVELTYLEPSANALNAAPDGSPWWWQLSPMVHSPVVDCTTEWDEWWSTRPSLRKTWARQERNLLERGSGRFEVLSSWAEVSGVIEEVFSVEASGWKAELGTAIVQQSDTYKFYTELIPWMAELGTLRLFLLYLDDRIAAFQLNSQHAGVLSMLKIGYLDDLSKQSPGQVLWLQVLRHAFADPAVEVLDMLGGSLEPDRTKLNYATDQVTLSRLRCFSSGPRGRWAWARLSLAPALKRRARSLRSGKQPSKTDTSD